MSEHHLAASDLRIDADVEAPRAARRFSSTYLGEMGLDRDARWAPLLVVSELVTNVVRHGGPSLVLSLSSSRPGHLRIAVSDNGTGHVGTASDQGVSGRGLEIVETLSSKWGVDERPDGKTVWSELDLDHLAVP
ncbi:MAG: putative sensor protein [Acidimicrobiia bacterium]|nr:putative sensor protein [Acidimicrobiia bacterium]